jgi:hypothetical protein
MVTFQEPQPVRSRLSRLWSAAIVKVKLVGLSHN